MRARRLAQMAFQARLLSGQAGYDQNGPADSFQTDELSLKDSSVHLSRGFLRMGFEAFAGLRTNGMAGEELVLYFRSERGFHGQGTAEEGIVDGGGSAVFA